MMDDMAGRPSPLSPPGEKSRDAPLVFRPGDLLREARHQKSGEGLPPAAGRPGRFGRGWVCYHTTLNEFEHEGERFGIPGRAAGVSFTILVAEQLFAPACRLLLSTTSACQIVESRLPSYFVLIVRSLRDEGTSHHYLSPSEPTTDGQLADAAHATLALVLVQLHRGTVGTSHPPSREAETVILAARGAVATTALYAWQGTVPPSAVLRAPGEMECAPGDSPGLYGMALGWTGSSLGSDRVLGLLILERDGAQVSEG